MDNPFLNIMKAVTEQQTNFLQSVLTSNQLNPLDLEFHFQWKMDGYKFWFEKKKESK